MDLLRLRRALRRRVLSGVLRRVHPKVQVQVTGRPLYVDLRDRVIARLLYVEGDFEPEIRRFIQSLELTGKVCLDVGANIGLHTLTMSEQVGPAGKVIAFEPERHNLELLRDNLRLNRVANVDVREAAVGAREGTCWLTLSSYNYGDHRVTPGAPAGQAGQAVPLVSLDEATRDVPPGQIALIKIDVQGSEPEVVRGMQRLLARNPDVVLIVEICPETLEAAGSSASKLVQELRDLGFGGWELLPRRLVPLCEPWAYDQISGGLSLDVLLCRNPTLLKKALERSFWRELPRRADTAPSQPSGPA